MVVCGCVIIKDQQCDSILNHPAKSTLKSTRQQYHEKLMHLGIYVCTNAQTQATTLMTKEAVDLKESKEG